MSQLRPIPVSTGMDRRFLGIGISKSDSSKGMVEVDHFVVISFEYGDSV